MVIFWPVVGIVGIVGLAPVVSNQNEKTHKQYIDVGLVYPTVVISQAFWWSGGSRGPVLMASFVHMGRGILQLNCSHVFHQTKNLPNENLPNDPQDLPGPFAGLLFCTSVGVLNYGSSTVEMSMKIGERLLDLSLRDAQATTEKEALVMPKGGWFFLFVCLQGTRSGCCPFFFGGGRGLIYDFELFVCRVWSGVVICDRALGSHQSQGLKALSKCATISHAVGVFVHM